MTASVEVKAAGSPVLVRRDPDNAEAGPSDGSTWEVVASGRSHVFHIYGTQALYIEELNTHTDG